MSSTRPIMVAGPIDRNWNPRRRGSFETLGGGSAGGGAAGACAPNHPAINRRKDPASSNRNEREFRIENLLWAVVNENFSTVGQAVLPPVSARRRRILNALSASG